MSPHQLASSSSSSSSSSLQAWLDSIPDYSTADGEVHYYQFDVIEGVDPADLMLLANEQQQQTQVQATQHNNAETSTPESNATAIDDEDTHHDNKDNCSDTGSYFSALTGASNNDDGSDRDSLSAQGFQWPTPRELPVQDENLTISLNLAGFDINPNFTQQQQQQQQQQPFPLLHLPLDIIDIVSTHLSNRDRKALRLSCRDLACATHLSIPRVFLSVSPRDIEVCLAIAAHPFYRNRVTELVWDDARLPETEVDAMHYYADLLYGARPRAPLPLGSGFAAGEEEEELLMWSGGEMAPAPHWFRRCQALNDVRLTEAGLKDPAQTRSMPVATATAAAHMSDISTSSSTSSNSSAGAHINRRRGRLVRLRQAANWHTLEVRRNGVTVHYADREEEANHMALEAEAAAKAARDWQYYAQLVRGRREVEQSGVHIAALDTALDAFPRLRTVTVTYIAHGRGGPEQKPVYQTPTIRAFPRGYNYPVPLGWMDGRHGARLDRVMENMSQGRWAAQYRYDISRDLDTSDGLSLVLRRLASSGISTEGKGKGKEQQQQRPPVELRIDDGGLGQGVDFAALTRVDNNLHDDRPFSTSDGRSNYDVLSQIMVQSGFEKLCLQMAGLTHEQCALHFGSGAFGKLLGQANGGKGLSRLELACNADSNKEWWTPSVPTVPVGKMLTADNMAAMQHLRLSHMAVDEDELVEVLGRLPGTIKTIELYDVRLVNVATGPEESRAVGWCRVLSRVRRVVGPRWAAMKPRPVLRIGVSRRIGRDGRELTALGQRVWVGEDGLAAVLYGDNGAVALAQWLVGGACEGCRMDDVLDADFEMQV